MPYLSGKDVAIILQYLQMKLGPWFSKTTVHNHSKWEDEEGCYFLVPLAIKYTSHFDSFVAYLDPEFTKQRFKTSRPNKSTTNIAEELALWRSPYQGMYSRQAVNRCMLGSCGPYLVTPVNLNNVIHLIDE